MVTVAALLETADTLAVIPAGALALVVPSALLYQAIEPAVPSATLTVVTAKLALPSVPATIDPD